MPPRAQNPEPPSEVGSEPEEGELRGAARLEADLMEAELDEMPVTPREAAPLGPVTVTLQGDGGPRPVAAVAWEPLPVQEPPAPDGAPSGLGGLLEWLRLRRLQALGA